MPGLSLHELAARHEYLTACLRDANDPGEIEELHRQRELILTALWQRLDDLNEREED